MCHVHAPSQRHLVIVHAMSKTDPQKGSLNSYKDSVVTVACN